MRPKLISEIIGQEKAIEQIKIIIGAAKKMGKCPSHILLCAAPGLGKTTIANVIANEMGASLVTLHGANLKSPKHIISSLLNLSENSVLFIDEIHAVSQIVQEFLFTALEDFKIYIQDEECFDLPKFCCVGATTSHGLLCRPMLDRFKNHVILESYSIEDLTKIIETHSLRINCPLNTKLAQEVAKRSRGTARLALSYTEWLRDYALSKNITLLNIKDIVEAFGILSVSDIGLTKDDEVYLTHLKSFGQTALSSLVSAVNVSEETILNVIEPYLIRIGKIQINKGGRCLI